MLGRLNKPFRDKRLEEEFLGIKQAMTIRASKIIYLSLAAGLITIEASDDVAGYAWIPFGAHALRLCLVGFLLAYVACIHYARPIIQRHFVPIFVLTGVLVLATQHLLEYLSRNNNDPSFYFLSTASLTYLQVIGLFTFLKPRLWISFPIGIFIFLLSAEFARHAYPTHALALQRLLYYQVAAIALGLVIHHWALKDDRRLFLQNKRLAKTASLQKKLIAAQEEANETKSRFISMLSHEMRTPMNAIMNTISLMELKGLFADTQAQKLAHGVRTSSERLLKTMNDILDYAQGDAVGVSTLQSQSFHLRDLLDGIETLFAATAATKGLLLKSELRGDDTRPLLTDYEKLNRVIINLVSNALKFTQQGQVMVIATRAQLQGACADLVKIDVIDTGIGIERDQLQKIFRPFYQVDSARDRKFQGNGLGLAICSQIVHALGGSVTVSSVPGQGTHFAVELTLPFQVP
jgi:signal transduction histidine kinase